MFPWATQEKKIRWNTFSLVIMPHAFHFLWVFQVFLQKFKFPRVFWDSANFSNSLGFPAFPCFPGLWAHCKSCLDMFYWKQQMIIPCPASQSNQCPGNCSIMSKTGDIALKDSVWYKIQTTKIYVDFSIVRAANTAISKILKFFIQKCGIVK